MRYDTIVSQLPSGDVLTRTEVFGFPNFWMPLQSQGYELCPNWKISGTTLVNRVGESISLFEKEDAIRLWLLEQNTGFLTRVHITEEQLKYYSSTSEHLQCLAIQAQLKKDYKCTLQDGFVVISKGNLLYQVIPFWQGYSDTDKSFSTQYLVDCEAHLGS